MALRGCRVDGSRRDVAGGAPAQARGGTGRPLRGAGRGRQPSRRRVGDGRGGARSARARPPPRGGVADVARRRRPGARALRLVVRALPALVGRLPRRREGAAGARRARLRRPVPPAGPSDRSHEPQGEEQHAARDRERRRLALGDRLGGGRARRDQPRARHVGGLRGDGRRCENRGRRARARLRDPVLAGPPVAEGASGVVQPPARRHAEVRGEPAQEVPGHLQRQFRVGGLGGSVGGAPRRRALLGASRHHALPRRQPAHEAGPVLGVADRRGALEAPRRDLPGGGVHAPVDDDDACEDRLRAELHVLHVEELESGARRVHAAARCVARVLSAQRVREHAGHPARVPAAGRTAGFRGAARARRNSRPYVWHLLGLRVVRECPGAARIGGVHELGEVRGEGTRARRPAAATRAAAEPRPPCGACAAARRQRALARDRERPVDRVREGRRRLRRQPRPLRRAGGRMRDPGRARLPAGVRRARPAERPGLHVACRPQLRQARPGQGAPDQGGRMTDAATPGHWFERDPDWFKKAVFYEIHLRGFFDGNDDGSGDFRGLADKLDYLQWLGVDCLWLLPYYPSPLRDGGYDIADFYSIHPDYGSIEDFKYFVDQAHQRGMRVIADLVMNHTSSDHPWFQASRTDPDGPYGDWYVWGDDDTRWSEARIIFIDTEPSNWTWDPIRGQYYWHRFFSHQPDLNYDNPEVQEQMLNVLGFWLDIGLDGFRLDAVPYLYERDGTNGENLPETHEFLRRVRAEVDARYSDRVLLAEANQWPDDVVEYFGEGEGDECHMAFHFPVMPRMFMAVRREDALPMIEILESPPPIPTNAQWGLFLRNHDELTLEMVTDDERDYMYEEYAKDPRMKLNLGIRRRLAPLLDNGRDEIQLMHAILFSLPGAPVLYYGDEIGMGDNIFLGDRDGVRTPMQWTGDRNGGFSRADFQQLYLPPLMDPVYGYNAVNVEAQLRTPTSLLRWIHRLIALRKEHPVFGLGTYEALRPTNPRIFAHVRTYEDDIVLCVHNLARSAQAVELDLSRWEGCVPEEMLGRTRFPRIGELPYLLTLAPRGFFWFQLRKDESG